MIILAVVIGIVVVVMLVIAGMYNGLVKTNVRAEEAWSDITVQLKRRMDLIPNLVSTVKGYAKHEAETLQKVVEQRSNAIGGSVKETEQTDNMLTGALKSVFAVAESYPDLKANQNFLQLQEELVDTGMLGFKKREFFETEDRAAAEKPVEVKF